MGWRVWGTRVHGHWGHVCVATGDTCAQCLPCTFCEWAMSKAAELDLLGWLVAVEVECELKPF